MTFKQRAIEEFRKEVEDVFHSQDFVTLEKWNKDIAPFTLALQNVMTRALDSHTEEIVKPLERIRDSLATRYSKVMSRKPDIKMDTFYLDTYKALEEAITLIRGV